MVFEKKYCILACKAFQDALSYLNIRQHHPLLEIRCLPSSLHLKPLELKQKLISEIHQLSERQIKVGCLYGHCFADIDDVLSMENISRIPVGQCYEVLLGSSQFERIMANQIGSFFMEKDLLMNFDAYCWYPLELYDLEIREMYFRHYRQVVYVRQPQDPDLNQPAKKIADRLNLDLKVIDANYQELEAHIIRLLHHMGAI